MPGKIAHPRSKISGNEGGFKEFRIEELFDAQTGDVDLQQIDINGKGNIFINSGLENCGIKGKTDRKAKIFPPNTLTVDFWGNSYYRSFEYKMATHNHVFSLFPKYKMNECIGLYITSQMNYLKKIFSYGNMGTWTRIKEQMIFLPTTKNGNIDFSYMEKYIEELQQQQHNKIETFFKNIGLDNCELTRKETESLRRFKNQQIEFKQFEIVEKFNVKNSQNNLKSDVVFESGNTPYVTASEGNNSVVSRISCADNLKESGNSIMIGGKTLVVTYQPEDFVSNDSHNLILYLKDSEKRTENIQLFCVCALNHFLKPIYSWGDSISKTKIQKDILSLPVTAHGSIDYDFMETFISAQKKLVAQKVVRWLEQQNINDNILKIEKNTPKQVLPMAADQKKKYKRGENFPLPV